MSSPVSETVESLPKKSLAEYPEEVQKLVNEFKLAGLKNIAKEYELKGFSTLSKVKLAERIVAYRQSKK